MKTNGHENVYNFELTGREASVLSMALLNYVRKDCPEPKGIQQELLEIVRRLDDFLASGTERKEAELLEKEFWDQSKRRFPYYEPDPNDNAGYKENKQ